jgi:hypothetical protein
MSEALERMKAEVAHMEELEQLGRKAMDRIDERVRKYFAPFYSSEVWTISSETGEKKFAGLCCVNCEHWISAGHDDNCAVPHVFKLLGLKLVLEREGDDTTASTVPV